MNKVDKAAWAREYRKNNKQVVANSKLKSKMNNREKHAILQRKIDFRRRFGITLEYYNELRQLQNNKCAICLKIFEGKPGPCVDHCHYTNKIRGLLCRSCNLGIGLLGDTKECLERAINYLAKV